MTKDDIMRMALEAGIRDSMEYPHMECDEQSLERFAELVAAAEQEACAKVCDDWPVGRDDVYSIGQAIRARGNQ
jgi:hypothetical protein